jgi:hypothetical protein
VGVNPGRLPRGDGFEVSVKGNYGSRCTELLFLGVGHRAWQVGTLISVTGHLHGNCHLVVSYFLNK